MSGVDKFDAIVTKKLYAKLGHGSHKVWIHLLWYLVNMAISNAWVFVPTKFQKTTAEKVDHMVF